MWSFPLTIKTGSILTILAVLACGCTTSSGPAEDAYNDILHGTIAYPFASPNESLGSNVAGEKFIIRSAVGNREYAIEIPGGARDFNVEVPLAQIDTAERSWSSHSANVSNPAQTDRELVSSLPNIEATNPHDTALLDSAFGVGNRDGPNQAPSYAIGISKINQHFRSREYEYALIEINNLLTFYPTSTKLLKMKGTVLVKMHNYALAEKSWSKALELSPSDKSLRQGLEQLQRRLTGH